MRRSFSSGSVIECHVGRWRWHIVAALYCGLLVFGCNKSDEVTGPDGGKEVTCPGTVIGDTSGTPGVDITSASSSGNRRISGTARDVDAREIRVVLWAKTDKWYVQPLIASPYTDICSDGSWSNWSHPWNRMVALLVDQSYSPGATPTNHPSSDAGVVAWDEWPDQMSRPPCPAEPPRAAVYDGCSIAPLLPHKKT